MPEIFFCLYLTLFWVLCSGMVIDGQISPRPARSCFEWSWDLFSWYFVELEKTRVVFRLSLPYKIFHYPKHLLHPCLYEHFIPARLTRNISSVNDLAFHIPRHRTENYSRNVIHFYSRLWNILPNQVVQCVDLKHFKAALKTYLDSLARANIPPQHILILSRLLWAVHFRICADVLSSVLKQY